MAIRYTAICVGIIFSLFCQVLANQLTPAKRIISLVPALTEMLFAIGAGPQVTGVSNFARYPPEVHALPRVGGLIDPDMERIILLRPDLVILYESQMDLREQLGQAKIQVFPYTHGGLTHVTETIRALGTRTGLVAGAEQVATSIEKHLDDIQDQLKGSERPTTLLVLDREPLTLRNVYVSGGTGFLHEMLELAGGTNVFAEIDKESLQPTTEAILAAAPDVIVEVRVSLDLTDEDLERERLVWERLESIPAIKNDRVYVLNASDLVVPGPRIADGAIRLANVLHPELSF